MPLLYHDQCVNRLTFYACFTGSVTTRAAVTGAPPGLEPTLTPPMLIL
jgi:hypothetical protein